MTVVAQVVRGDDLLEIVRELEPDVIIMDVELGGQLRGWQALTALKADAETTNIPVVAYADLDFPWYVSEAERPCLERACLELADACLSPNCLCSEIPVALEQLRTQCHSSDTLEKNMGSDEDSAERRPKKQGDH